METTIQQYIEQINRIYLSGEATEHSYRGEFKKLCEDSLNGVANTKAAKNSVASYPVYQLINEPKRKKYGAPDYELLKGDTAVAFIEAKNIGEPDLRGEKSKQNKEQFDKYKKAISTIAFTDYLNIILYENGAETLSACIGKVENGRITVSQDALQISNFEEIMKRLGKAKPQSIKGATKLVEKMADKARLMATILRNAMNVEESEQIDEDKELWGKLKTFQKYLVHDMSMDQFVDFYSQTVLYGLFIARINTSDPEVFSIHEAGDLILGINPFLKKIFKELAVAHLHPYVKGIVQDLVLLFKVSNLQKILKSYKKDPLVHFYEAFIEKYDPKVREQFGVWYTPKEVVTFIVDAVDYLLKTKLDIEEGLADNSLSEDGKWHKVQILDPATGTGTFLAETVSKIKENYEGQEGLWRSDIVDHIIPRMNGFEYLVAPYTMAHLKLSTVFGLDNPDALVPDRLNIFLTNSLEEDHPEETLEFARYITDESNAASQVKRESPVMVIMGNPPYKEKSANKGEWIMTLMDDYKQEPGEKKKLIGRTKTGHGKYKNTLEEKNAKGINNDYCKFIRLGHNFVNRTESGVMAYICGNTFTKTNIFRGMRYQLLKDFDEIYVINLHGSSKFDESTGNAVDENIFDIMVGVSINIFVKKNGKGEDLAKVFYKDIYGLRKEKLRSLDSIKLEDMDFEEISAVAPYYELSPKTEDFEFLQKKYEEGFNLSELFKEKVQGFKTGNDEAVIRDTKEEVERMLSDLTSAKTDEEIIEKYKFKDSRDWKLTIARKNLKNNSKLGAFISEVYYRPFDKRFTCVHKDIMNYPRPLIQDSLLHKENMTLCIGKQGTAMGNTEWSLAYISDLPTDMNVNPRGGAYLFPLYLYDRLGMRVFNFRQEMIEVFEQRTGLKLQREDDTEREPGSFLGIDMVDYVYAVLHSKKYRKKYHQFLQNGFPTIPYPESAQYFFELANKGRDLRNLHLLKGIKTKDFITRYPVEDGNDMVSQRLFVSSDGETGKVWINDKRYFDGVPKRAWDLVISGYRPLEKWLKDRNGKILTGDEIRHYQKMIVALDRTASVMEEIDRIVQL